MRHFPRPPLQAGMDTPLFVRHPFLDADHIILTRAMRLTVSPALDQLILPKRALPFHANAH
jgi:hypothetical protein